jgi:hypothetical protein
MQKIAMPILLMADSVLLILFVLEILIRVVVDMVMRRVAMQIAMELEAGILGDALGQGQIIVLEL